MILHFTKKITAYYIVILQNEGEKESSTSESSLESSSGYGSQTTFPADDTQHMEGKKVLVGCIKACVHYFDLFFFYF